MAKLFRGVVLASAFLGSALGLYLVAVPYAAEPLYRHRNEKIRQGLTAIAIPFNCALEVQAQEGLPTAQEDLWLDPLVWYWSTQPHGHPLKIERDADVLQLTTATWQNTYSYDFHGQIRAFSIVARGDPQLARASREALFHVAVATPWLVGSEFQKTDSLSYEECLANLRLQPIAERVEQLENQFGSATVFTDVDAGGAVVISVSDGRWFSTRMRTKGADVMSLECTTFDSYGAAIHSFPTSRLRLVAVWPRDMGAPALKESAVLKSMPVE